MIVTIKDGKVGLETSNAFGTSNNPDSPHYIDQMEMYTKRQTKKMSLNTTEI